MDIVRTTAAIGRMGGHCSAPHSHTPAKNRCGTPRRQGCCDSAFHCGLSIMMSKTHLAELRGEPVVVVVDLLQGSQCKPRES